jgi:hypothetical protein
VSPVKYELGSYIPKDAILHSHRRENLKSHRLYLLQNMRKAEGVTEEEYGREMRSTCWSVGVLEVNTWAVNHETRRSVPQPRYANEMETV